MQTSMVFGGIISKIDLARCPFGVKLALVTSVFDPVGTHVCKSLRDDMAARGRVNPSAKMDGTSLMTKL